jgi:hypothetical protein
MRYGFTARLGCGNKTLKHVVRNNCHFGLRSGLRISTFTSADTDTSVSLANGTCGYLLFLTGMTSEGEKNLNLRHSEGEKKPKFKAFSCQSSCSATKTVNKPPFKNFSDFL